MKKNKKSAIEATTLVLYIILIAVALSLVGVTAYFTKLATKDVRKKACEWDIMKAAFTKKLPLGTLFTGGHRFVPLTNCRRDKLGDLVIKYGDVVENGFINQYKAHKIIADEMVECWKMVGAGTRDPFSNWDNNDNSYCMVCTTIKFDKKLQDYYVESLTNEKLATKRGENALIKHPIPWMINNDYKKGTSYYKFIYKSNPQYSYKELEEMSNYFITEDTTLMLKLYKFEDRNTWQTIVSWGTIIVGAITLVAGIALTATGVGAVIGVPMSAIGGKIIAAGVTVIIVGGAVSLAGGVALAGVAIFDPVNVNPFSECEECNGVGSMKIIPPQFELSQQIKIEYDLGEKGKVKEEGPYCSIIVN